MKKKILAFVLCLTLVATLLTTSILAFTTPSGGAANSTVPELTTRTIMPLMTKLISKDLTASDTTVVVDPLTGDWKTWRNMELTDAQKAEIGNHFNYGFSVIGIKTSQRAPITVVDGHWASAGFKPIEKPVNDAMNDARGQFSFKFDSNVYNYAGEKKAPADATEGDGYIYELLMTFNFGKIANLESFGYYISDATKESYIQAADIYVSDNGTDWTLVGYYDHEAMRVENAGAAQPENPNFISSEGLGADANNKTITDQHVLLFDLPADTKGQFLRVAATTGTGKANVTTDVWGDGLVSHDGVGHYFNEMFVFGTLTDEIGYQPSQETDATDTTETQEQETTGSTILVKPKETSAQNETTAAPETDAVTDAATEENKGGCSAAVGMSMGLIGIVATGAIVLSKRKKK